MLSVKPTKVTAIPYSPGWETELPANFELSVILYLMSVRVVVRGYYWLEKSTDSSLTFSWRTLNSRKIPV